MQNERDTDEPPVLTLALFVQLTSLFVLLSIVSAADLVFRGLRRHPIPTQTPIWAVPGGNAERGAEAIRRYGCTACHTFPGMRQAEGRVGPGLEDFRNRVFIAGLLPNTPEHLLTWIQDPQSVDPETAMPDLEVAERDARDIAAYLYSND